MLQWVSGLKYKVVDLQSDLPSDFFSFGIKLITMIREQRNRISVGNGILAEIIKRSLVTLHFNFNVRTCKDSPSAAGCCSAH
jgi:hypothetical protein